jgi:hypothetical protein
MTGLSMISSVLGRLFKTQEPSVVSPTSTPTVSPVASGIHPGLTDQQLVVLLTAAAYEIVGAPVQIKKLRSLAGRDRNWVAQGRSELHTHRLK